MFYFKTQTPIFIATRDLCQFRHRYVNEKGQTVMALYSDEHPDVPLVKKYVRVEMGTSGYIMTPLANGGTRVVYQLKMRINLPRFMIDGFYKKHGCRMHEVEQALDSLRKNQL